MLSVDKFRDDQVMQLQYLEDTKTIKRKYGLQLWDYPKENTFKERVARVKELMKLEDEKKMQAGIQQMREDSLLMVDRLFVGKDFNKNVGLFIRDDSGNQRIKLYIDKNNDPRLKFFDDEGKVIHAICCN